MPQRKRDSRRKPGENFMRPTYHARSHHDLVMDGLKFYGRIRSLAMIAINSGQCGLCTHFGEPHPATPTLTQIHSSKQAPETFIDDCGHPKHAPLHLKVSAMSGCDGFEPAASA
jgi:hypothetical protein